MYDWCEIWSELVEMGMREQWVVSANLGVWGCVQAAPLKERQGGVPGRRIRWGVDAGCRGTLGGRNQADIGEVPRLGL